MSKMAEKYIKVTSCGDCPFYGCMADACQHIDRVPGCTFSDRCPLENQDPRADYKTVEKLTDKIIETVYKITIKKRSYLAFHDICSKALEYQEKQMRKLARPE